MLYCVAPENIPTYPKEGIRNSRAEGVSKTQTFQAKNTAKLEFPGGDHRANPFHEEGGRIFCGTTHYG